VFTIVGPVGFNRIEVFAGRRFLVLASEDRVLRLPGTLSAIFVAAWLAGCTSVPPAAADCGSDALAGR
jgi:hypothetical protein